MEFEQQSIHVIRSISQLALAATWAANAGSRAFPSLSASDLDKRVHDPNQLVVWSVEGDNRPRTFRAAHQGALVRDGFGANWIGKTMQEVLPEEVHRFAAETAEECVESGCAIYTIFGTVDARGHAVECERLQLPYGRDHVDHIVASLQLISLEGSFRRSEVLDQFIAKLSVKCCARIRAVDARRAPSAASP